MTQETLTKIETIAIYDGWEEDCILEPGSTMLWRHKERDGFRWFKDMPYLTSLDWLHPVAMKVLGEPKLKDKSDGITIIAKIIRACSSAPINGEYIALFNAVYDGIVFLNQLKSKENEH